MRCHNKGEKGSSPAVADTTDSLILIGEKMNLEEAMLLAFDYLEETYKPKWTTGKGSKEALIRAYSQNLVPKSQFLGYSGNDGVYHSFNRAIPEHNKPKGTLWEHWLLSNIGLFQCSECNMVLPYIDKISTKNRFLCKTCDVYSSSNRRERNQKLVAQILLNSRGCVTCGEKDIRCLDFDHKDPSTKVFNIGEGYLKKESDLVNEIAKCDIVCANCHRKKTSKDYSYYKEKFYQDS